MGHRACAHLVPACCRCALEKLIGAPRRWATVETYGDEALLAEMYPAAAAFVENMTALADNATGLLTYGDFGQCSRMWRAQRGQLIAHRAVPVVPGDWYAVFQCDTPLASGFSQLVALDVMRRAAAALNLPGEAARWSQLHERTRAAYHTAYFDGASGCYRSTAGAQCANTLPLAAGPLHAGCGHRIAVGVCSQGLSLPTT